MHSFILASISFNSIGKDNYFTKLNLANIFNFLENNYILGSELKDCGLLEYSYKFLVDHHSNNSDLGAYLCNCKMYYTIQNCGNPNPGSSGVHRCPTCDLYITGRPNTMHKLDRGVGIYRIFKDKEEAEKKYKQYSFNDYDWKTLEDIKNELENEKLKSEQKSLYIYDMGLDEIKKKSWSIRKLNHLAYRILSFFYNSLVFLMKKENDEEKLKNIYLKSSPLELMEINYKFIEELLKERGIDNASLFMLFLESKMINLFDDMKSTTIEERRNAENNFNILVESCLKDFNDKKEGLEKVTSNDIKCDKYSLQSIIEEKFDINSYHKNTYPLLNDFTIKSVPTKEELIQIINNDDKFSLKYPILHLLVMDMFKLKQMECLLPMNKLANLLMENFSFKIDRDDAKKITIGKAFNDIKIEPKILDEYLKLFNKSWISINKYARRYQCRKEMEVKESLSINDSLSYLLNDVGDFKNGMYLAAAYQHLISVQNDILSKIKNSLIQSTSGKNYITLLEEEMTIQDAKEINILKENYGLEIDNINELLFYHCFRNQDFKSINYESNLNAMEIYLREAILIGKKKFKEKQKFVIYKYETYKGENSSILTKFI